MPTLSDSQTLTLLVLFWSTVKLLMATLCKSAFMQILPYPQILV